MTEIKIRRPVFFILLFTLNVFIFHKSYTMNKDIHNGVSRISYSSEQTKNTELIEACLTCNSEKVAELLKNGANPNILDQHKKPPLLYLCNQENFSKNTKKIILNLLRYGALYNFNDLLWLALKNAWARVAIFLINKKNFQEWNLTSEKVIDFAHICNKYEWIDQIRWRTLKRIFINKCILNKPEIVRSFIFYCINGNTLLHELCEQSPQAKEKKTSRRSSYGTVEESEYVIKILPKFYITLEFITIFSEFKKELLHKILQEQISYTCSQEEENFLKTNSLDPLIAKEIAFLQMLWKFQENSKKMISLFINKKNSNEQTILNIAEKYGLREIVKILSNFT